MALTLEVEYPVLRPFLNLFEGDMSKTMNTILTHVVYSTLLKVKGQLFFRYLNNNYHISENSPSRIDKLLIGDLNGQKLPYKKKRITFPRTDRIVALALNDLPYYKNWYFKDHTDESLYKLRYKNEDKRWILERREMDNLDILFKSDILNDPTFPKSHVGIEIIDDYTNDKNKGAKWSYTCFHGYLIQNQRGEFSKEDLGVLTEMVNALLIIDKEFSKVLSTKKANSPTTPSLQHRHQSQ
jgi:hypothetical protein